VSDDRWPHWVKAGRPQSSLMVGHSYGTVCVLRLMKLFSWPLGGDERAVWPVVHPHNQTEADPSTAIKRRTLSNFYPRSRGLVDCSACFRTTWASIWGEVPLIYTLCTGQTHHFLMKSLELCSIR
jgi:hypothetical protein